jgi:pyrimidine-nucleoside phosphorylase
MLKAKSSRDSKPSFSYLIEKKRDGGEFTDGEIRFIVDSILDEEMPEFQQAAWVMATYFQGMSAQETATFAEEMMLSGEVIEMMDVSRPKIEKYSTGGVGDKTSLVLGPLAAAAGVAMPLMNGDDEEFLTSNGEKLSAIPKINTAIGLEEFSEQIRKVGCAFADLHEEISPVESILYELRKKIGAIPSIPFITAGTLSRKLAAGAEGVVVDVKWGKGSFIKTADDAKQLARSITRVGRTLKRRCVALVTDVNQPLGSCVGASLEIKEAIELLKGEGPEDLQTLVMKLGMEIVRLAGVAGSTLSAKQTVRKHLEDGTALQKFKDVVEYQGGNSKLIDEPDKLPTAKHTKKLPAPKRGYVHTIDAGQLARGVQILAHGAGKKFDPAAGVAELCKVGTQMKQGEPLMIIHYNDEKRLNSAMDYFKASYRLAPKRPNPAPLIVERVA